MTFLKEKYLKLIVMLQESNNYIKGKDIATRLGISDRSVRNYVKDLNENYLIDSKILTNKNKGYILTGAVEDFKVSEHYEFEERMFFIVKYLLSVEEWTTYDEIAESLFFSNQTIRLDVIKIQKMIETQFKDLKIESVIFKGVRLTGSEIEKRLLLESLSKATTRNRKNIFSTFSYHFKEWIDTETLEHFLAFFENEFESLQIPNNPDTMISIISYLLISFYRVTQKHYCDYNFCPSDLEKIGSTKEYEVAASVMNEYGAQTAIAIPKIEIIYFSFYLISQRLLFSTSEDGIPDVPVELKNAVMNSLEVLDGVYSMDLSQDEQLYSGLVMHLARDLYPLLFNFYIENSFITTIKKEYIQGYYMAVSFANDLKQSMQLQLPENEIGYIAIHFASYIERSKSKQVNIGLLMKQHQSSGFLLKKELERRYENVSITMPGFDGQKFEMTPAKFDFFIACGFSDIQVEHLVVINAIPREVDYQKIDRLIKRKNYFHHTQIDYFTKEKFENKEALLRHLLMGIKTPEVFDSILEREEFSTTDISDGIAIPHPLITSHQEKIKIAVAVQEKSIDWGSKSVDLIIMIVPGKKDQHMTSRTMEEIYHIIKDPALIEKIKKANNLVEFNKIIENREMKT